MIAYSCIGVSDMEAARQFYDQLLGEIGGKVAMERPDGGFVAYSNGSGPMFGLATPFDGGTASPGNGNMVTIACENPEHVAALHAKAVELGATNDGDPGPRLDGACSCGYVKDPDGNKLNFFCMSS